MPSKRRLIQYARCLTHSSGNMWPRSSEAQLEELAPLLPFMWRIVIGEHWVKKAVEAPTSQIAKESAEHQALKHLAFRLLAISEGGVEMEKDLGFGRIDVVAPEQKIACECGDVSAGRLVNIILEGWTPAIMPFPKGDMAQWQRVKLYTINPTARGIGRVIDEIRERRDASMRRCADALNLF